MFCGEAAPRIRPCSKEFAAMSITASLLQHHKHCDELFADAENACSKEDWPAGEQGFVRLRGQLETHFASEEEILFPAFEAATGMTSGPTAIMRGEHRGMRELLAQMQGALAARDSEAFAGGAGTLLILMQQHNVKEENILYPMCDNALAASDVGVSLTERLKA
jgi:iron-sulfur cluster repair protein YtfE (RIC family)